MAQVAIPAAIMAGSAIVKKLRKPAALTPQGTQAQGNLLGNAGSLRDAGNSLLGSGAALQKTGMGAFNKANADLNIPMNYYRTIAGGSRGAMTAAMAPEMGAITSAYRGAESALDRGPARGALEVDRQRYGWVIHQELVQRVAWAFHALAEHAPLEERGLRVAAGGRIQPRTVTINQAVVQHVG